MVVKSPIVRCNRTKPKPHSADADCIAVCEQSADSYLCKSQDQTKLLPLTEWICSTLAKDIGLPVPDFSVVEVETMPEKRMFGSKWVSGLIDPLQVNLTCIANSEEFSRIFATDLFAHNIDRHYANYLYVNVGNSINLMAIDFSRAFLYHGWPLPPLPMGPCNTLNFKTKWEVLFPVATQEALLGMILAMPVEWMENIIALAPDEWCDAETKSRLCSWWKQDRSSRVDAVKGVLI